MTTPATKLWSILMTHIPLGEWVNIRSIYEIVKRNYHDFSEDDLEQVTATNGEPTWHRNLRNALQTKRDEMQYDGDANYRIDRPYIWRMIREAVNDIGGRVSYTQIKEYIHNRWTDVNADTITAQTIVLIVNHPSRTHYPENQRSRKANSNSPYDFLFRTERGRVVKYDESVHGIWEIFAVSSDKHSVKQVIDAPKLYTPTDIKWFKNVSNAFDGEAYMQEADNPFVIHFPTKHKGNVLEPTVGEIILIYQKLKGNKAFTHLVTPYDNDLIDDSTRPAYRYGRRVKYLAKTSIENAIPVSSTFWSKVKLSGITQGNACRIDNISNIENADELRLDIWNRFKEYFLYGEQASIEATSAVISELGATGPAFSASEGNLKLVSHLVRERNRKVVEEKKRLAIMAGTLRCEVCNFSFKELFGKDFIECHHTTPIATGGVRETTVDDLALVCPNCHRMLHTKFDGRFVTIEQLSEKIKATICAK